MVDAGEGVTGLSDVALVVALTRRNRDALAEIYTRHGGQVYGLARQVCGVERAEEVVKQVFLEMWERPQRYNPDRGSLKTFLLTRGHESACALIREKPPVHAAALSDLPDGQRDAIVLASFDGHTYRDVAGLLGQSEGTIKNRIRAGLHSLRHSARRGLSAEPEKPAGIAT
jgi:RNA polymerase sigma-70 factor, ECF subfamily